tara:strand:- start:1858 stop:2781 length:924 start_codon:yes stop_codon:yes gene_type:complete
MIAKTIQGIAKSSFVQSLKEKNRSKIIIFPNWNGVGLGFFVFFCFLISVFYENNFGLLLSIIIFFIFFISIFVSNQNLNHLTINALDNYYIEANKNEAIDIQIVNQVNEKKLNIDLDYKNLNLKELNFPKKLNQLKLYDQYSERGIFSISRVILKSIYPFGIIRTKRYFDAKSKIVVYPKKLKPNIDMLNEFNINLKGHANDEFEGIEDYKNGDSFSKIAWKKSIIKNKKYIKKFEEPKKENKLILNLDNYKEINFEDLLSYVSYIVDYYYKNKIQLTIKHRDNTFYLNQSQNSYHQILKYLANVKN